MKILVADDHDLVREAIAAVLGREPGLEVSIAADLEEAMEIAERERFDIVLLDWDMPGMDGLGGLERMRLTTGGRPVALMSGTASPDVARAALAAGACGFVPKSLNSQSTAAALRLMAAGEVFAPYAVMGEPTAPKGELTPREAEVLRGLVAGQSNKEIARVLDLQEVTVKLHVRTLSRKLGAKNRTQAAMIGRDRRLI